MPTTSISAIHLSPADGWFAAYAVAREPYLELKRIVSFAVVERGSGVKVDGIDSDLQLCNERSEYDDDKQRWTLPHCIGFYHEEDLTDQVRESLAKTAHAYKK